MKAAELRLGNFIQVRKGKIVPMIIHDLNLMLEWERVKYSRTPPIKPVPLTEEWLLKFDFHLLEDGNLRNGMLIVTKNSKDELTVTIRLIMLKSIKYVHQLQNLYFALTGNELTIK